MFILKPNPNHEMRVLLKGVKRKLGYVPEHWELFASINPVRFKMFLEQIDYLVNHPNIHSDFFALLRYTIANDNGFAFCITLNRSFLLATGYTQKQLQGLEGSKKSLPLDQRHQALFDATIKAVYRPEEFTKETINTLKVFEWTDADIFDAVDHGAFLFQFSKVIKAYSKD